MDILREVAGVFVVFVIAGAILYAFLSVAVSAAACWHDRSEPAGPGYSSGQKEFTEASTEAEADEAARQAARADAQQQATDY